MNIRGPAWQSADINMLLSKESVRDSGGGQPSGAGQTPTSKLSKQRLLCFPPSRERLPRPPGTETERRLLCTGLCDQKRS